MMNYFDSCKPALFLKEYIYTKFSMDYKDSCSCSSLQDVNFSIRY